MKKFSDLKIGTKLIAGFVLVALIAGVIGVFGISIISTIEEDDKELYEHMTVPISQMSEISTAFQGIRVTARDMIFAESLTEINSYVQKIQNGKETINKYADAFQKLIISEEMSAAFKEFKDAQTAYRTQLDKVIDLAKENKNAEALALLSENGDAGKASKIEQDAIEKIIQMKVEDAKNKADENLSVATSSTVFMIIFVIIAMCISIILGYLISKGISKPLNKALYMIGEMSLGHFGVRLNIKNKDEIGQMAAAMDNLADELQNTVIGTMKKISEGDLNVKLEPKDDKDEIIPALKMTIDTLNNLIAEAKMLTNAAVEGKLGTRGNAESFKGGYKQIVDGVNKTLDAVIGPLNIAADYVDKISKGNIPSKITDTYNGDFNTIKNNLNTCIDAVNSLVADANMLSVAAVEGRLETRADASRHQGDFRKIVEGVNHTLDAVIEPVKEASNVLKEMARGNLHVNVKGNYMGDHAEIKDALNDSINTILSYVSEISSVLTQIANGNLDVGITADYRGDFVEIKNSLNNIIQSLNEVLGDINNAADQVAAGSRQVSDGSQALSQGSTEQASSIEELSASITEIASQTKQNAINANQANELALTAKENAVQGNSQMKEMLNSMVEINSSSANISKIIKVIDDIAFQTNILALNAAVEAARAGQHGKGFAVVAEEVRNLAARSANAAKETTSLIEGSIEKVGAGTKIANETAEALNKIVTGVEKAANLVGQIASASNEQASGIAQINKGIEQVSMVVQTNSATAEESAAASEELSSQSELLKEMVNRFKLRRGPKFSGRNSNSYYDEDEHKFPDVKNSLSGIKAAYKEAAADGIKPRIALSDKEFGKY